MAAFSSRFVNPCRRHAPPVFRLRAAASSAGWLRSLSAAGVARTSSTTAVGRGPSDDLGGGSDETLRRKWDKIDRASVRLYRILLREVQSVGSVGGGGLDSCDQNERSDDDDERPALLLQPPLDPRDWGRARFLSQRRRKRPQRGMGAANGPRMEEEEEEAVRDVLRFFRREVARGGNDGDDDEDNDDISVVGGLHSMGHYTRFLSDDDDDDESDESSPDDNDDDDAEIDPCLFVSRRTLRDAVRLSFPRRCRRAADDVDAAQGTGTGTSDATMPPERAIVLQRDAIRASQLLREQVEAWTERSSVTVDATHGVRVVATSRCIGRSPSFSEQSMRSGPSTYHFAYRIRIENIGISRGSNANANVDDDSEEEDAQFVPGVAPEASKGVAVQLLGRTWNITEDVPASAAEKSGGGEAGGDDPRIGEVVKVHEPTTGVVGNWPVLHPGEVFEYMSGCKLATRTGTMGGYFHMAVVDEGTESSEGGDYVEALQFDSDDDRRFRMPVGFFGLVAD